MSTRLYLIRKFEDPGDAGRLVEAAHPSQALRHVAEDVFEVSVPTALEATRLMKLGVTPERAGKQDLATGAPQSKPLSELPLDRDPF